MKILKKEETLITAEQVREDLKNIRYYYAHKESMESSFKITRETSVVNLAAKYNGIVREAPIKLYDLYANLYLRNITQEALSIVMNYTPQYIRLLNKELVDFFQKQLEY